MAVKNPLPKKQISHPSILKPTESSAAEYLLNDSIGIQTQEESAEESNETKNINVNEYVNEQLNEEIHVNVNEEVNENINKNIHENIYVSDTPEREKEIHPYAAALRKPKFEEQNTLRSFWIDNSILERFDKVAKGNYGVGKRLINEALDMYLKKIKA